MIYKYRNSKQKCDKLKPKKKKKKRTILKGWDEGTTVQAFPFKRKLYLEFEKKYENCTVDFDAACPIVIDSCDASANSKNFSKCTVDFSTHRGFPLASFFQLGQEELTSYLLGKRVNKSEAIVKLEHFIANDKHTECLLSLHQNKDYSEFNIQVILAVHLFGPLAGDYSYKIRKDGSTKDRKTRCPLCSLDVSAAVQDTSLGNGNVWNGYADILEKNSVVKIGFNEDADVEDRSDELLHKTIRTGSTEDDEISSSDDSDSVVEARIDEIGSRAISKGLAQTIVNSFCEVKKNPSLCRCFVPSFIATDQSLRICMYNCDIDRVIMTQDLNLFFFEGSKSVPIVNFKTILSIWYALNFDIFFDKMEPESESSVEFLQCYKKSNFKEQAGVKYCIYKENCTKPMIVKPTEKQLNFEINPEFLLSSVMPGVKKMVMYHKEVKSVLSCNS